MTQSPHDKSTGASSYTKAYYEFDFILLGSINVGKTAIVNRVIDNQFREQYKCTLGIESKKKSFYVGYNMVNMTLWDTCGEERFMSLTKQYYRNKEGIILVYDMTNRSSFNNLAKWMSEINENSEDSVCIIIVGNKFDLIKEDKDKVIAKDELDNLFLLYNKDRDLQYIEVSAKDNINIDDIFINLSKRLIEKEPKLNGDLSHISDSVEVTYLYQNKKDEKEKKDINDISFNKQKKRKGNCCK